MALARTYDAIFNRYRGRLPLNLMRSLAYSESRLNPSSGGGSYYGLFQVGYKSVLPSYNSRHGTSYSPNDLFDPTVNTKIISDFLGRIVAAYGRHPSANMKEDWRNPEFVKLLVAGHNSGYSESGGVGRVATYLEQRGIPVTHDNVFRYAGAAGATKHLQNDKKRAWQAAVVDRFYEEGGPGPGWMTIILVVGVGYAFYKTLTR